jgi:hypothetical protein
LERLFEVGRVFDPGQDLGQGEARLIVLGTLAEALAVPSLRVGEAACPGVDLGQPLHVVHRPSDGDHLGEKGNRPVILAGADGAAGLAPPQAHGPG